MLYKYLPIERIDVIENLTIRFSPLRSLNDPFDSRPLVDISSEMKAITDQAELDFATQDVFDDNGQIVTSEQFEAALLDVRQNLESELNTSAIGGSVVDSLGDRFGTLSLSRTKASLLMWCHYASEGQGYLIAFDSAHEYFNRVNPLGDSIGPMSVAYSTVRPKVTLRDNDYYEKLFCNKPLEWSYEEEARIFCVFSEDAPVHGIDSFGQSIRFSHIPIDAIGGIYLGYNSSEALRDRVKAAHLKNGLECSLYQGSICEDQYKICFKQIST